MARDLRPQPSRRDFLRASSTAAAAAALPLGVAEAAFGGGGDTLKIGLVGCGGRGSGAVVQALRAEPRAVLWSLGDAFADRIDNLLAMLEDEEGPVERSRIQVAPERRHVGLKSHQPVTDEVDVVLFATPPGFRPMQIEYAAEVGRHVFAEKPAATDGPGIRRVLAAAEEFDRKGKCFAHGFCWRAYEPWRAAIREIHDGRMGPLRAAYVTYLAGPLWHRGRKPEWTELEYQVRNWLYFTPLSGDHLVEQAVHSVDKVMWAMGDRPPKHVTAQGGRQVRTDPKYGNVYDHFDVVWEWDDGAVATLQCRQMEGTLGENLDHFVGATGRMDADGWAANFVVDGDFPWRYEGPRNDMYQTEHDELFAAIREGRPLNQARQMATSTLAAIMGRMSAYTGQRVTWDMALQSKEELVPTDDAWDLDQPLHCEVAMPGRTRFL